MTQLALTPLQADLVEMLRAMQAAEHDLAATDPDAAADVLGHLSAWRAIEARRLLATQLDDDPAPGDPIDESNARIHAERAEWSAERALREADASIDALVEAIRASSTEALCECDELAAGIGANGVNHALGHLSDLARDAGQEARYAAFGAAVEAILHRGHLPPRDSGVMLYNLACHDALAGRTDEALRRLHSAFARRPDLREYAPDDPDLEPIRGSLVSI